MLDMFMKKKSLLLLSTLTITAVSAAILYISNRNVELKQSIADPQGQYTLSMSNGYHDHRITSLGNIRVHYLKHDTQLGNEVEFWYCNTIDDIYDAQGRIPVMMNDSFTHRSDYNYSTNTWDNAIWNMTSITVKFTGSVSLRANFLYPSDDEPHKYTFEDDAEEKALTSEQEVKFNYYATQFPDEFVLKAKSDAYISSIVITYSC